ncbi:TPA: hypothetical protein DHT42_02655 [Candidatus Nomurabacteria bacterium]|nr:hypothetical protein [Candidatus Nomurabacteria bacterium]
MCSDKIFSAEFKSDSSIYPVGNGNIFYHAFSEIQQYFCFTRFYHKIILGSHVNFGFCVRFRISW